MHVIPTETIPNTLLAGTRIISVFANPLNTAVLRAHGEHPRRLGDLRKEVNWAAEATIRGSISSLRDLGALEKQRRGPARNSVATAITPAGVEMLDVALVLEQWLLRCPNGPITIGGGQVTIAVKALAEGWNSTVMHALATGPLALTELNAVIDDISYPSLERRVAWMRSTGQISALPKGARGTPYEPTDWLRQAIAPLCVAGRCERRHLDGASPISGIEVEAAFLMALPLVRLHRSAQGSCLLGSRIDIADAGDDSALAGVAVEVVGGEIISTTLDLHAKPTTWAIGTSEVWLDSVIDGKIGKLRIGGSSPQLARDLVFGLHRSLFTDR